VSTIALDDGTMRYASTLQSVPERRQLRVVCCENDGVGSCWEVAGGGLTGGVDELGGLAS